MILLFSGIHSLSLQHAYFPLSVSLNFHSTSGYKNNLPSVSKYCFTFPELNIFKVVALDPLPMVLTLRLQESSVYGYQFIRGFLKKDLMSTQFLSPFHWFF